MFRYICVVYISCNTHSKTVPKKKNHTGSVMVNVRALRTIYRGFGPRSGQNKDYDIVVAASPLITQH